MTFRLRIAIGLSPLLLLSVTACSGDDTASAADPQWLDVGPDETALCLPTRPGEELVVGDAVLTNRLDTAVTLADVTLVGAHGLELVDAVVVPYERTVDVVGFRYASDTADLPDDWREGNAAGTPIPPDEAVNLVLVLDPGPDGEGEMSAARLRLTTDGDSGEQSTLTSVRATPDDCD